MHKILNLNPEINVKDKNGFTPLWEAIENNQEDIAIKMVTEMNADIFLGDELCPFTLAA